MSALPRREDLDAVLLDAGETLIFMQPSFLGAFAVVAREHGHDLTEDDVRPGVEHVAHLLEERAHTRTDLRCDQGTETAMWREFNRIIFRDAGLGEDDVENLAEAMQQWFNAGRLNRVADDTVDTLQRLRAAGLKLGIVSNAVAEMSHVLSLCGVAEEVDHITISCDVGWEKPSPEIFRHSLAALGVEPSRAIHVGDSLAADIGGAKAAGLAGAVLKLNGRPAPGIHGAPTIRHLSELLGLLGID